MQYYVTPHARRHQRWRIRQGQAVSQAADPWTVLGLNPPRPPTHYMLDMAQHELLGIDAIPPLQQAEQLVVLCGRRCELPSLHKVSETH